MDVGLGIFGWVKLDDQVDIWDVETSGCHVSSYENLELAISESFEGHFSLVLSDVSVHGLDIVGDLTCCQEGVGVRLGRCKHQYLSVATIEVHYIKN